MKQLNGGFISSIEVWKGHRRATKECKGLIGLKSKNGPANHDMDHAVGKS